MNKVIHGTPNHSSQSMCATCRAAFVVRGLADSSERVYCRMFTHPPVMPQPIVECGSYDDKRQASKYEMEQIAWMLVTNRAGKAIGFVSAEDFRKQQIPPPPIGF